MVGNFVSWYWSWDWFVGSGVCIDLAWVWLCNTILFFLYLLCFLHCYCIDFIFGLLCDCNKVDDEEEFSWENVTSPQHLEERCLVSMQQLHILLCNEEVMQIDPEMGPLFCRNVGSACAIRWIDSYLRSACLIMNLCLCLIPNSKNATGQIWKKFCLHPGTQESWGSSYWVCYWESGRALWMVSKHPGNHMENWRRGTNTAVVEALINH